MNQGRDKEDPNAAVISCGVGPHVLVLSNERVRVLAIVGLATDDQWHITAVYDACLPARCAGFDILERQDVADVRDLRANRKAVFMSTLAQGLMIENSTYLLVAGDDCVRVETFARCGLSRHVNDANA